MLSFLSAICGIYFPEDKEGAFSQFKLWQAVGWITSYSYGKHLRTYAKIYIFISFSVLGILGYLMTELLNRKQKSTSEKSTIKKNLFWNELLVNLVSAIPVGNIAFHENNATKDTYNC